MFQYFINTYGNQLLMAVLCAIFGMLGHSLKVVCKAWLDNDTKRSVARVAVQFVEQVFTTLHGHEKLRQALETARSMLEKKGIDFDASEMQVLIEAAVAEFNDAFHKPLSDGATAEAARWVEDGTGVLPGLYD